MASFSCHAFGVSKRFRLERIVRPQAYAAKWPMASVMARQTETYARLTAARAGQGLPERSSPEARPSNTPTPRKKNQGVKRRSEEHTSELQSLMRISYAVFCLKKKKHKNQP